MWAAILTIVGGLAIVFHWGKTGRDMMINEANLEKERDDYIATKPIILKKSDIKYQPVLFHSHDKSPLQVIVD